MLLGVFVVVATVASVTSSVTNTPVTVTSTALSYNGMVTPISQTVTLTSTPAYWSSHKAAFNCGYANALFPNTCTRNETSSSGYAYAAGWASPGSDYTEDYGSITITFRAYVSKSLHSANSLGNAMSNLQYDPSRLTNSLQALGVQLYSSYSYAP